MDISREEQILQMQLTWVQRADEKVPPVFAIDVAMLGVIAALMKSSETWSTSGALVTACCLILLCVSLFFLILTMFPRLSGPQGSNIFFGGISTSTETTYIEKVKKMTDEEYETDVLQQTHRNAQIASAKYFNIKVSFISLFLSVPFWVGAIYLISI